MNCPVCSDTHLQMTERKGVEIDYCPKCRGVWLDRGELDKIIERAGPDSQAAPQPPQYPAPPVPQAPQQFPQQPPPQPYYGNQNVRRDDDSDVKFRYPQQDGHYKKKRESFLSDIFDF